MERRVVLGSRRFALATRRYRPARQAMQLAVAREDLARVKIQRRAV
jgi:hypothetical protein